MSHRGGHHPPVVCVLAWEFWARGWRGILAAPLGALVVPVFLFGSLTSMPGNEPLAGSRNFILLHFAFYWLVLMMLGSSLVPAFGEPKHRYALPATSLVLFSVPMLCGMTAIFAQYAVVALTLNAMFDAGWGIVGPGLLGAVLVAWFHALFWNTANVPALRILACLVGSLPVVYLLTIRMPTDDARLPTNAWWFVTSTALCVAAGSWGFNRQRHGAGVGLPNVGEAIARIVAPRRRSPGRLASPMTAQFWREWRERGFLLPEITVCVGITGLALACVLPHGKDVLGGTLTFFLVPLSVMGVAWGNRTPTGEFGSFNGSRPLSDNQIASTVLRNATLSLVLSALIGAGFMTLIVLMRWDELLASKFYRAIQQLDIVALSARGILTGIALWSGSCLMASLALAGRRVLGTAYLLVFGVPLSGMIASQALPSDARPALVMMCLLGWIGCGVIGCAVVYVASWRRRLLPIGTCWLAALVALTALVLAYTAGWNLSGKTQLALVCSAGLVPLPLAAAPLAVYFNRHR